MARSDKGMVFFYDWRDTFEELPGNECKALLLAMLDYCQSDVEPPKFKGKAGIAASFIFSFLKRSKQNARAGKKGMGERYKDNNSVNNGVNNNDTTPLGNQDQDRNQDRNQDKNQDRNNVGDNNADNAPDRFNEFWDAYPRKAAKANARNSWEKLSPDDALCSLILSAVQRQKRSAQWMKENGRFIPNPSTWLDQRRWEDELPEQTKHEPASFDTNEFFEAALQKTLENANGGAV